MFCHDIHDVLLEFTKCNVYLGKREGSRYQFYHEVAGYFGFAVLTLTWFVIQSYCLYIHIYADLNDIFSIIQGSFSGYIGSH